MLVGHLQSPFWGRTSAARMRPSMRGVWRMLRVIALNVELVVQRHQRIIAEGDVGRLDQQRLARVAESSVTSAWSSTASNCGLL